MPFTLPPLPYAFSALEPILDTKTMEIHHGKHHQAYIDKLNSVIDAHSELQDKDIETLLRERETLALSDAEKRIIQHHGGGHANHTLFWQIMNPNLPKDDHLISEITKTFGSVDTMKKQFNDNAVKHFGSGWSWLVRNTEGTLELYTTANQDSPLMRGHTPIIGLDVWEHAYYLQYQNRRQEYVEKWWGLIHIV
jgi:superoxide dismutase, Fe-Mn family